MSRLHVGQITGVYGVKGYVRVFSATDPREAVTDFAWLWVKIGADWVLREVEDGRAHGRGVVLKLVDCDDRETALALKGADLEIEREWLPAAEPGTYYWADLQGLRVLDRAGDSLGQVTGLMQTGANDVLLVHGEREHLIPWVQGTYILEVDLDAGVIRVDWDKTF